MSSVVAAAVHEVAPSTRRETGSADALVSGWPSTVTVALTGMTRPSLAMFMTGAASIGRSNATLGVPTVTLKDLVVVLPAASDAVHRTVVRPSEKVDPDGGAQLVAGAAVRLSVAVVAGHATAADVPDVGTVRSAGTVSTGGVLSRPASTVKEAEPPPLVAVQVCAVTGVSTVSGRSSHPALELTVEPSSVTVQSSAPSPVSQGVFPAVPVRTPVIRGGEVSSTVSSPSPTNDRAYPAGLATVPGAMVIG